MKKKLFLILSLCCLFLGTSLALANNHGDTRWSFTLGAGQRNSYTGPRAKKDRTAAYAKCTSVTKGEKIRCWLQMSDGRECRSPKYELKQGQARKITNYAYEQHGKCYVRLAVENARFGTKSIFANGVWSPDSV